MSILYLFGLIDDLHFQVTLSIFNWQSGRNLWAMKQHFLRNVNNCLNTNIYSYVETSCGQSSNLYINVVHLFNTSVN